MCGNKLFGHKNKKYCFSKKIPGSCAQKREASLARQRKLESKYTNIQSYLYSLGGRTKDDLEYDENGNLFVLMWSGVIHAPVRFYLPKHLQ